MSLSCNIKKNRVSSHNLSLIIGKESVDFHGLKHFGQHPEKCTWKVDIRGSFYVESGGWTVVRKTSS